MMKISEILEKRGQRISFEVFPPKSSSSFESVREATEKIASLSPSYMSVTYGAGGGTSKYTLDIAKNIQNNYGVPSLAHLTCVSSSRDTVRQRIEEMKAEGIKNVMALRGDIPVGMENMPRDYKYAIELIRDLRESDGDFCLGGACYPEGHPESRGPERDIYFLKEKVDAGLDFLTTQMFFDNKLYYDFLDRAVVCGITLPIIPGIMPITNTKQVERAITLSGSYMPKDFLALVDKYGSDGEKMAEVGISYAVKQIRDLFENGVSNVHVYTMNKPEVAKTILSQLSDLLGE